MQAQLAGLHSTVVCNQTTAPIYSPPETSSSVPATTKAQDTERLSSTEKHIQDINLIGFKETASRKVVKNSHTDDIVRAFTENGTPVEAIDTKTDTPVYRTALSGHPDIVSLMPSPVIGGLSMQGAMFLFFLTDLWCGGVGGVAMPSSRVGCRD